MRTTLDVDENLLREAEQKAMQQGKSLGTLLEEVLRLAIQPHDDVSQDMKAGLGADDPFFIALDEIRATGRIPARSRHLAFD